MQSKCRILCFLMLLGLPASAMAGPGEVSCTLHFQMSGWSAFYRTANGTGVVTCEDGQRLEVSLSATGGGVTFGKTEITDGEGKFSGLYDIHEVLGGYVTAEAHAGATKSAKAQVMTKGPVSLALTGHGRGWSVGFAFGKFTIKQR